MGIHFEAPLALLLLPPLIAVVVVLHLSSRRRLGIVRRRVALAVRVLLLSFLVFALAGFQLVLPVDRLAVVYVVDLSDSVGTAGREEALAYLRESLAAKEDEDVAGIVAFGGDALVERLPRLRSGIDPEIAFAGTLRIAQGYAQLEAAHAEAAASTPSTSTPVTSKPMTS